MRTAVLGDNTHWARRMATENAAICSHRYKTEDAKMAVCDDCRQPLWRVAVPVKSGKTARKKAAQ